jgi:hypothetical protein
MVTGLCSIYQPDSTSTEVFQIFINEEVRFPTSLGFRPPSFASYLALLAFLTDE